MLKSRQRHRLLPADGIHELLFNPPSTFQLWGHGNFLELSVGWTATKELVCGSVVSERAVASEQPDFGSGSKPCDVAELEARLGAALQSGNYVDVVGHAYRPQHPLRILSLPNVDLRQRHYLFRFTDPAQHAFIPDPQRQD